MDRCLNECVSRATVGTSDADGGDCVCDKCGADVCGYCGRVAPEDGKSFCAECSKTTALDSWGLSEVCPQCRDYVYSALVKMDERFVKAVLYEVKAFAANHGIRR